MDFLVDFLLNFYGPTPYLLIFGILLLCGLGLPIPEDITLFAGGLIAYYGLCDIYWMIAISFLGVMIGDSIVFYLGGHWGSRLTKRWPFNRLLPPDRLELVRQKFNQKGNRLLFAARFMPGLRAPIFFSAGVLKVPYRTFLLYDGGAALISVPLIVGAVYAFGDELDQVVRVIKRVEHGILFVILAVILTVIVKWYLSRRKLRQA